MITNVFASALMSDSEVVINIKGSVIFFMNQIKGDLINKPPGPSELKLQLTISIDKTVADLKQAIADKSEVPADRQRLIYSGRSSALTFSFYMFYRS
jgi:hypothetical protein